MPDPAEVSFGDFADFVAREHDGLRRLAVLLEDDRTDADELLQGVLVTVRSRWRRLRSPGAPLRESRRLLVRRALRRRPSDGPRASGWVDDPYAGWDADRHDDLRRALAALPTPTRAAVVLSLWAGLPDREVGHLLRSPEDAVRGEVVAGLTPLRSALAPVATPWQLGTRLPDDGDLRSELTALADDGAPDADAVAAASAVESALAARRRRRWPIAVVAAAATALAVAVPALSDEDPAPAAAQGSAERTRAPRVPQVVDVSGLATRGPLAGDREFLADLVRRPWEHDSSGVYPYDVTTAEDSRRVLYAGDVPAGRWALLVGRPEPVDPVQGGNGEPFFSEDLVMAWFTGPRGAAAEDMVLTTYPYGFVPDMTPALLDAASGTLVVVGAPGDAVEVSERVEVAADGSDTRTWTPVPVVDGIATAELEPVDLPWTWAVDYRIFRDDGMVRAAPPDGTAFPDPHLELPDLDVRYPDGIPNAAGRRAAGWAAFIGLSSLGAPTDDTDVTARVLEPVPGGEGTVALVTVTLPSGAFLVSAQWAWDIAEGIPGGADCGLEVRPADPPPDQRLLVAACQMYDPLDGRALGTVLVAATPPGVAALRLYESDGTFLEEQPVHGTSHVARIAGAVRTVEAVTADGVLLGRSQVLGHWSPTTD